MFKVGAAMVLVRRMRKHTLRTDAVNVAKFTKYVPDVKVF